MVRLKALKDTRYATRRLKAGDEFEAQPQFAKIWISMGWAEQIDAPVQPPRRRGRPPKPRPEPVAPPEPVDPELERLRALHETLAGPVDGRWSKETLRERLETAQAEADAAAKADTSDDLESPPGSPAND